MSKHNDRKHSGRKGVMGTFLALLLIGALAIAVPVIMQDMELNRDAAEYEELRQELATSAPVPTSDEHKPIDPAVNIDISDETETPDSETEESGDEPEPSAAAAEPQATENPAAEESAAPSQVLEERTVPDMAALKAQNDDFAAWIQIPGTNVDYPVVVSDNTEYYLTHTFTGKESKIGTLFSLAKTDYAAPSRNIAIYGHNIKSSGNNMFRTLHSYKDQGFYAEHDTVYFDTLYRSGVYSIFAVLNMIDGEWDPSTAMFVDDEAFMRFVERVRAQSMYETGVDVTLQDEILTLITCDRSYSSPDGRLLVMAVRQ